MIQKHTSLRVTAAMEQGDFGEVSRGLSKIAVCKVKQARTISFKAIAIMESGQCSDLTPLAQRAEGFYFVFHFKFLLKFKFLFKFKLFI